ncbi:MAG: MFS transporter [Actinomycetia bacterium]|nr:MFS transporter [Actinomycetes bacterium]
MRSGRDYWLLIGGSTTSNLGDGIRFAALPLLAVTITDDPAAIGAVMAASFLPWLLFSLVGGAVADRQDRRRLIISGQLVRGTAVGIFALLVATDHTSMALIYVIAIIIGVGEVVVDSAFQAAIPQVAGDDLDRANSHLATSQFVAGEILGGPIGGALFTIATFLPFLVDAISFLAGALLVWLIATPLQEPIEAEAKATSMIDDIKEGARFLVGQPVLRGIAAAVALSNLADSATRGLMVLMVTNKLDGSEVIFGLIITVGAVGGMVGSMAAPRVVSWLGRRVALITAFISMAAGNAIIGLAPNLILIGVGSFGVMFAVTLFNVSSHSIRQRLTPNRLLGRVIATMRFIGTGAIPVGALGGGILARIIGVREAILVAAAIGLVATWAVVAATAGQDLELAATD